MPPQLEGRAFSRLQQFATLPEELQNEIKALELHLTEQQAEVFGPHHANLIKTVRSVRAKPLLEKITAWLKAKDTPPAAEPTTTTTTTEDQPNQQEPAAESNQPAEATPAAEPAAPVAAPIEATLPAADAAPTPEPESKPADADKEAEARYLARAKQLLEGLVLHGFITLNKEHEKLPSATNTPGSLVFKDSELFVPLATAIADNNGPSFTVWQLVDGAVFAGFVKRKAGFLAPLTQGKDAYLVANETLKTVTLFETDVGRVPVAQFEAANTNVSFDKSHFVHGIKIWNETSVELINVGTKLERESLVHALVSLGLQYREEPTLDVAKITSIYELKDVDIDGNEVLFEQFKGKVLLVVNVSSQCGLTPTNYPELASLDAKYKEQGLQVLAFPCNQFGGQEPGSHEEIKAFVQQYSVAFPLFAKGDVNGVETRPLFSFLKFKLAGPEGDTYIKWNFTKFLVDRNGVPVKRFGPMELPLSFESEIVTLLFQQPEPEVVESKAEAPTTEAPTTEAPTTETPTTETPTTEAPTTEEAAATTDAQAETSTAATTTTTTTTTESAPVVTEVVKTEAAPTTETTSTTTKSDGETIKTVVTKVTTLSVENHPVEETTTTTTTTTSETQSKPHALQQETNVVVPGFTPGNEPAP